MLDHPPFPYQRTSSDVDRESRGVFRVLHDKGLGLDCTYNRPELHAMNATTQRPLCWLWEDKIPLGKLTLIEGPPAVGKLFVTLDIAARVSTGELCREPRSDFGHCGAPAHSDPTGTAAGETPAPQITTTPPPNPPVNGGEDAGVSDEACASPTPAFEALPENDCRVSLRERACFRGAKDDNPASCSRADPSTPVNGGAGVSTAGKTPAPQITTTPPPGPPANGGEDAGAFFESVLDPQERRRKSTDVFRIPEPLAEPLPEPPADGGHPVILVCDSWQAEDMVAARLRTLGADLSRVVMFSDVNCTDQCGGHKHSRPIRFPLDLQMFDYILRQNRGCRLVVIDNLENYCDSPRQIRRAIQELNEMAIYFGVAIVATLQGNVRFAPDGTIRDTARTSDGQARCIWSLTPDAVHPGLLRLEPKRMAFCKKPEGIACRISDAGKVLWEPLPPYEKPPTEAARRKKLERERLRTWLEATLGMEVVRAETIYDAGKEQGFSKKMLIAAREELGARTFKYGFGCAGGWLWTLKPDSEVTDADVQIASIGLPEGYTLDPKAAPESENSGVLNENGRKTGSFQASPAGRKQPRRFADLNTAQLREIALRMLGLSAGTRQESSKEEGGHAGNGHAGNGHANNGHSRNGK